MPPRSKKTDDKAKDDGGDAAVKTDATAAAATAEAKPSDDAAPAKKVDDTAVPSGYQWWEDENAQTTKRGDVRWTTLSHNGVFFPPEYVPHGIAINYDGKPFPMSPEEEEVATMFAVLKNHDYYRNPTFRKNFFVDFVHILNKRPEPHPVRVLEYCDFEPIWQWHLKQKEAKDNLTKAEKKKIKAELDKAMEPYKFCMWDGRKEPVGNARVEPPGLFRGRGVHPLAGCLKKRVYPEHITLNLDRDAPIPEPPAGHKWGQIVHQNTVTWLAMWTDNVTDAPKYVMLGTAATVKTMSDRDKFERARRLKGVIDKIRTSYRALWKAPDIPSQCKGVVVYFIDKLALRAGNDKDGETEAETVGACSLQVDHCMPLSEGYKLHFHFLGKDSIMYDNTVEVDPEVHALVAKFRQGRPGHEKLFFDLDPSVVNDWCSTFMPDLTAKVFRTYNASVCLQEQLKLMPIPKEATVAEKVAIFVKANTQVALLCNHQRAVSKSHKQQMLNLRSKLDAVEGAMRRYERAQHLAETKSEQEAMRIFYEEEDKAHYAWLDQWGTPEDRADYEEYRAQRAASTAVAMPSRKKPSAAAEPSPSKPKKAKASSPSKKKKGDTADAAAAESDGEQEGGGEEDEEESSSDDDSKAASEDDFLGNIISAGKQKAAAAAGGATKKRKAGQKASRSPSPAPAKGKKGGKKEAARSASPKPAATGKKAAAKKAASPSPKKSPSPAPAKKGGKAAAGKKAKSPSRSPSPVKKRGGAAAKKSPSPPPAAVKKGGKNASKKSPSPPPAKKKGAKKSPSPPPKKKGKK